MAEATRPQRTGAYRGGLPAAAVGPPASTPSAFIVPDKSAAEFVPDPAVHDIPLAAAVISTTAAGRSVREVQKRMRASKSSGLKTTRRAASVARRRVGGAGT